LLTHLDYLRQRSTKYDVFILISFFPQVAKEQD